MKTIILLYYRINNDKKTNIALLYKLVDLPLIPVGWSIDGHVVYKSFIHTHKSLDADIGFASITIDMNEPFQEIEMWDFHKTNIACSELASFDVSECGYIDFTNKEDIILSEEDWDFKMIGDR